ncbi:MAG TPA: hypothetical protein VFM93_00560 [Candidatus Limnocylindria bacterium]|nr:hypothetical protein [Candidatus Limnocylindria bacterium]
MPEVAVAWPDDEATAGAIVSRLSADGIAARVDRGLWGSYQVPLARGQLTVLVSERDAARAKEILGHVPRPRRAPEGPLGGIAAIVAVGVAVAVVVWIVTSIAR